ncbi:O-antigen ligase [Cupriavidus alkaliphilus]|uniref:PglL family O-oligosaccharyltransferase n=1 Tax=Cupriavidus alkaliphilus TaxID=942866 RepID=UPI000DE74826|nr:O-antigen ligase family protein [Cupriavidus alkaliphilus]PVY80303.1 O-antigen ligase [Cupriavidus alkaliphilus]
MQSKFVTWGFRSAVALAFILWSVPFLVNPHTVPIPTFYAEVSAIVALALLSSVTLVLRICQGGTPRVALVTLGPVGLIVVLFIQLATIHTGRPMPTFLAIFFCVCAALAIQTGLWIGQDRIKAKVILQACALGSVAGGLISFALAWMQAFGLEGHYSPWVAEYQGTEGRRLFANLYQPNHLGTVCMLAMASVLYLRRTTGVNVVAVGATLFMLGIGAALTASRTPLLQAFVMAIGTTILARVRTSQQLAPISWRHALLWGAAPMVALVAGMLFVAWINRRFDLHLAISAVDRLSNSGDAVSPRLALWRYALEVFRTHPLLGAGWGEYVRAQYLIADRLGTVEVANNAHNVILDLLAKTGVLGVSTALLPCLAWVWCNIKAIFAGEEGSSRVYCIIVVSVVGMHAMLEFPQNYAFFLLPLCLLMGMTETRTFCFMTKGLSIAVSTAIIAVIAAGSVAGYRDYKKTEVAYEAGGALRYGANPAFVFADWARYGLVSTMALDKEFLAEKILMHENALTISASPNYIRRYIILLALDERTDEALHQVARLKSFSLGQFEQQYAWLIGMCDEQKGAVSGFKQRLIKRYGMPAFRDEKVLR